ncbi:pilus assembly protein PilM [Nitrincola lacisaponensis]|uniref:pilus assembly protein PilM n=1 Tax=Nitrincola lacisaponensis TaxID=267850 RepID=UPI000AD75952
MLNRLHRLIPRKQSADFIGLCVTRNSICLVQAANTDQADPLSLKHSRQSDFKTLDQATELLKGWVAELGLQGARVVLTLEQGDFELIQMDKPDVPETELQAATHWKLQEYLEYPVTEAISDIFEVPQGRHGHSNQLFAAVARRQRLLTLTKLVRDAGLQPAVIDIAQLAMRNLAERRIESGDTLGLVHCHAHDSRLYICRGDTFYITRVINLGLERLNTEDEMTQLQLVDQFALEVQRTMDYYDSHFGQSPVRQLHFLDRSGQIDWLPTAVTNLLGIQTALVDMPAQVQPTAQIDLAPLAWGGLIGRLAP